MCVMNRNVAEVVQINYVIHKQLKIPKQCMVWRLHGKAYEIVSHKYVSSNDIDDTIILLKVQTVQN